MMEKGWKIGLLLLFMCNMLMAQQDAMFTQHRLDKMSFNPGATGNSSFAIATASYRNQFMGFGEGAPTTSKFSLQYPLQSKYMGVGLKVGMDELGASSTSSITGTYAYHLGFGDGKLSFGLEGGIINYSLDFTDLIRTHPDDPAISYGKESTMIPDFSFGFFYEEEKYYLGITSAHVLKSKIDLLEYERNPHAYMFGHIYSMGGAKLSLGRRSPLAFAPSYFFKKTKGAPMQFDVNFNMSINDKYLAGLGFRSGDALVFMLSAELMESIVIGYSYDITTSKFSTYANGAQEITLGYKMKLLPPAREKEVHPRFYY